MEAAMQPRTEYRKITREGQLILPKHEAQNFVVRVPKPLYQRIKAAAAAAEKSQCRFVYELIQAGFDATDNAA